jgi:hypothetical protein
MPRHLFRAGGSTKKFNLTIWQTGFGGSSPRNTAENTVAKRVTAQRLLSCVFFHARSRTSRALVHDRLVNKRVMFIAEHTGDSWFIERINLSKKVVCVLF